jgi:hypothetical protein
MKILHVTRLSYPDVCSFINEAKKFEIEANISVGSISIYFDDDVSFNQQIDLIIELCDKYKGTLVFDKKAYDQRVKETLKKMGITP